MYYAYMPQKDEIIKRLIANSAEIITEDEFGERLSSDEKLTHYIGFEISGYVHIGQGIMSSLVMKDLAELGVKCTVWLADWHTWINDKLDGTKETAAKIGIGYFTEAIKVSFLAVGGDPSKLEFRLASDWYDKDFMKYMQLSMKIMQKTTDARLRRSIDIMGREMGDEVAMSSLMYPAMQVADVFYQNIDIVHAGTDQRKAYVIMRDVSHKLFPGEKKPMVLLHHLLPGLFSADGKMSKSKPGEALFIHDEPEILQQKIDKAYCAAKDIKQNPVLEWTKHLLFWNRTTPFTIKRKSEHGGTVQFETYGELEAAYAAGDIHPMDLKSAVAKELIELLAPVREHFAKPEIAAMKAELDKVLESR